MSFASHYHTLLKVVRGPALLVAVAGMGAFAFLYTRLPQVPVAVEPSRSVAHSLPTPPVDANLDWSHFRGMGGVSPGQPGFADAFRFAGTFFLSGSGSGAVRRAVLGIVAQDRQIIVSEGEHVEGVTVEQILEDRIVLRRGAETAELWLSFVTPTVSADEVGETAESSEESGQMRFGKRVGKDSWLLRRESLLEYYDELLDAPERLLQVFDSLKPLYTEDGRIEGYRLGIEGERDFFQAVGFEEGDVVRKVNSLAMTNRRRAEFFIRQVVDNKLSAVVIDIERGESNRRLVYQVR
jgi:type II secretory pathway component PulC